MIFYEKKGKARRLYSSNGIYHAKSSVQIEAWSFLRRNVRCEDHIDIVKSIKIFFCLDRGMIFYEEKGKVRRSHLFLPTVTREDGGKYRLVKIQKNFYILKMLVGKSFGSSRNTFLSSPFLPLMTLYFYFSSLFLCLDHILFIFPSSFLLSLFIWRFLFLLLFLFLFF